MALPSVTGTLNTDLSIVEPNDTTTWSQLTTWDDYSAWKANPANPLIWLTDILNLGEIRDFCLQITTDANGLVEYDVYVSNTGLFTGEETLTTVSHTATGVTSFTGQYVIVAVKVYQTQGVNYLSNVSLKATNNTIQVRLNDIDTSTLSGTTGVRTLSLPRAVSKIVNMTITTHELSSAYTLDLYVSSTQTSKEVVARVKDKSIATPQISLVGLDNQPRDCVVDVVITALPEQYMSGNNLTTR